ncbi:MAG: DUF5519 family protein [Chloroflexota bacterium]|nr:DUF5519 family protein [Chloroflexota bacterium]
MPQTIASRLRTALLRIDGIAESGSAFSKGDAFWINGTQIAHFMSDDTIELRLTRREISARRAQLKPDHRVVLRPSGADWMTLLFTSPRDVEWIIELARVAAAAHAPAPGVPAKPPPVGAALERRRRFH